MAVSLFFPIITFLDGITLTMLMAMWTPYMSSIGASSFYLGIIGSISAFISLIWSPLVGSLSDVFGRKKVLIQLLIVCTFANSLLIFSSNLVVIAASRLLAAFGSQIITILKSLMDDLIPNQNEKINAINKLGALTGFCFIIGPILSALLSDNPTLIFTIITLIFVLNTVFVSLINNESKKTKSKKSKKNNDTTNQLMAAFSNLKNINWPKYWDLFTIKITTEIALSMFFFNNGLVITKLGGNGKSVGYFMAFGGILGISFTLLLNKIKKQIYQNDKSGFQRLLHSNLILIFVLIGGALQTKLTWYMVCVLPFIISRVLGESTMMEAVLTRVKGGEEKGSVLGAFESTIALGGLIAPLISGIFIEMWGENIALLMAALPAAIAAVLAYKNNSKKY